MAEKVYLITGAELAAHSKEKILLALDWAETNAHAHPDVALPELIQYLRENVDSVVSGEEDWSYGATATTDLNVVELDVPEEEPETFEPVAVEENADDYNYNDEEDSEEEVPLVTDVDSYVYEEEEELPVEEPVVVNVYAIDVEDTILGILNREGTVNVNDLVAELSVKYTQELIGEGYWNLVNNNTIVTDETTGIVEIVKYESNSIPVEEEPAVEEEVAIGEEETDFFSTPAISRQKQYQGLLREAGQMDR